MKEILSVRTMRDSDAAAIAAGIPGTDLMGRAAKAVLVSGTFVPPVGIVCGVGNNAGDGYALALLLQERGTAAELILTEERFSSDAYFFFTRCRESGIPCRLYREGEDLSAYGTLVDCLFGTGFSGMARGRQADAIRQMNASGIPVVAVDIPSGLNGDSGLGDPAVKAERTVSIGSLKPGHFLGRAKDLRGELQNADIGIRPLAVDARLMEEKDAAACFPQRKNYSHKGSYGYLALAGGSLPYSGAPRLAAMAAVSMRSGAGVVMTAVPKGLCRILAPQMLESTLYPLSESEDGLLCFREEEWAVLCGRVRSMAFGMGIGRTRAVQDALSYILDSFTGRLVIDADGLAALAALGTDRLKSTGAAVVLTPHLGEASLLTGLSVSEIERDPLHFARSFAAEHRCTLLLKGPATLVTDGNETWLTDRGCPGMATAGSGDVLSGILAALLGFSPCSVPQTAAAAAYLSGMAGEAAEREVGATAMLSGDTAAQIAHCVRRLELRAGRATV